MDGRVGLMALSRAIEELLEGDCRTRGESIMGGGKYEPGD